MFSDNAQEIKPNNETNAKILIGTFQTLNTTDEDDEPKFWKDNFPKNYFSHIIIDECHRSAWGKWSIILKFSLMIPLGVYIGLEIFQSINAEDIKKLIGSFIIIALILQNIKFIKSMKRRELLITLFRNNEHHHIRDKPLQLLYTVSYTHLRAHETPEHRVLGGGR